MDMNAADKLSRRRPDYRQISSELAGGLIYAVRQDNKFLLIAGWSGETVLNEDQAKAMFYELGDILQEQMGVEL